MDELGLRIRKWLDDLQTSRKCSSTNAVSKAVTLLEPADQQKIMSLITDTILDLIGKEECPWEAVNVINGCFDNFPIAVEAISTIFQKIIEFLARVLEICWQYFRSEETVNLNMSHKEIVDIVHSVSRIGTLVLKSQRGRNNEAVPSFRGLSITCTNFIYYVDDIAMDTKINMGMILWLLREITFPMREKLIQFHQEFIDSLFNEQDDYNIKVTKFVMAAAAVNLWETAVINSSHTLKYLNFFLTLCESYGNETGLVLMISRCLQMLAKHSEFLNHGSNQNDRLVHCVMMLLEHSIACVRHSAKDLLQVLVRIPVLQDGFQRAILTTTPDKKSFYLGLAALAVVKDVRCLINSAIYLPELMIAGLDDPTSVPHVVLAIENLAVNDSLYRENEQEWIALWVLPLLTKLPQCLPIVAAEIEKLLFKLFKDKPDVIHLVLACMGETRNFRSLMVCFKIRNQIQGDGFQLFHQTFNFDEIETVLKHGDDDTRLGAFSLLVDGSITADTDLDRAVYFLKYNLNNHRPATRQRVVALFKRLLTRVVNCCKAISRSKNPENDEKLVQFLSNLVNFCYANIFAEANFNRLNTVLCILDICREIFDVGLASRCGLYNAVRWSPLQSALCSSYEENQIIAAELAKSLPFSEMELNDVNVLRQDLRIAFGHIQALEPPRVLLGTYTLYVLLHVPSMSRMLQLYFSDNIENPSDEPLVLSIQILARYLLLQTNDAQENAITAARNAPMYGTMFAIRLLLKHLEQRHLDLPATKKVLRDLIEISFKMADAVSPVVNNSSPEGHLPMDFQNIAGNDDGEIFRIDSSAFLEKFSGSVDAMISAYKTAETAEEKLVLAEHIRSHFEENFDEILVNERESSFYDFNPEEWYSRILDIGQSLAEYDCYYKFFQGHLPRIIEEPPVTAQALLLYSWRSMKEACLYLGDLVAKIPLKKSIECEILDENLLMKIGYKLRLLLSEIKHRGAFEQAEIGLSSLCRSLWDCPVPSLQHLPSEWLKEILNEIIRPPDQQTLKLTSTRRSAGLPFLVQAIITTQIASNYSPNSQTLNRTMTILLNIAEDSGNNLESRLHALNIMRALFQNSQLGEFVFPFISKALEIAIYGSRSETWSERNCSNMLFRALIVRIFGVSRSRDQLSKKNKMTSTSFFQRFPELLNVLYKELARAEFSSSNGVKPEPSLYLVLLLMGRLYPPSSQEIDLSRFLHLMGRCAGNPIMRIRVYAARALVPFVPAFKLKDEIVWRLSALKKKQSTNFRHGLLLQIIQLVMEIKNYDENLTDIEEEILTLLKDNLSPPFPVLHTLLQLCLILNCDWKILAFPNLLKTKWSPEYGIGADVCLTTLTLIKLQSVTNSTQNFETWKNVICDKDCGMITVENTILQYLYLILTPRQQWDNDYDFSLLQDEVKCIVPDVTQNLPDEFWSWYQSSETGLGSVTNIQQRRLRVLILARLVELSKVPHHDPFEGGLALLSLFSNYWDPDSSNTVLMDWLNSEKKTIVVSESLLARVVFRMELLLTSDKHCRLAVAIVFKQAKELLIPSNRSQLGVEYRKYWLILFRLLIDEDEDVRKACLETVLQLTLDTKILTEKINITALAAQELLIQCYSTISGPSSGLGVDFLLFAILTLSPPEDDTAPTDFMEIFKKGNPNPYSETLALSLLFIEAARSHLTDLEKSFPGGSDTITSLHNRLSPHFALNGLRMKMFTTPINLLNELRRLEPPDNADNLVFWCQVRQLLTLVPN